MNEKNQIWNCEITEIIEGYQETKQEYICTFCGQKYSKGMVYSMEEQMFDAYGAVRYHGKQVHGLTVDYLLGQEPGLLGISEIQRQLLQLMSDGATDNEIAKHLGIAASTVRNHRFKLREKEKQSRLFLAMMQSLAEKTNADIGTTEYGNIEEIHVSATMVDDRYNITEKDREQTIKNYMDENGALKLFPAKEKKKIILLGEIMKNFKRDTEYSEWEVNKVLKRIYEDFSTLRRALIEYGFMDRSADCKIYRVKE